MKVLKKILTCVLILSMSMGVMSVTAFADEAAIPESLYVCGIEAHEHGELCACGATQDEICGKEIHTHDGCSADGCTIPHDIACNTEEHVHSADKGCFAEGTGEVICPETEHTHTEESGCYTVHIHVDSCYDCGKAAHESHVEECYKTHVCNDACYTCGMAGHKHVLGCVSEENQQLVNETIAALNGVPALAEMQAARSGAYAQKNYEENADAAEAAYETYIAECFAEREAAVAAYYALPAELQALIPADAADLDELDTVFNRNNAASVSKDTDGYNFQAVFPRNRSYELGTHLNDGGHPMTVIMVDSDDVSGSWAPSDRYVFGVSDYEVLYCCEIKQPVVDGTHYKRVNLEDADYYDDDAAAHIRAIVTHSYPYVSLEQMKADLKASGYPYADELTRGDVISAVQFAIWHYSNANYAYVDGMSSYGSSIDINNVSYASAYHDYSNEMWHWWNTGRNATFEDADAETRVNALVDYLTGLEKSYAEENEIVISSVEIKGMEPVQEKDGVYNVVVKVVLNNGGINADDDVKITVSSKNAEGAVTGTTVAAVTQGVSEYDLVVEAKYGETIEVSVEGIQNLPESVYLYEPKGGKEVSQVMVGVASGLTVVSAHESVALDVPEGDPVTADMKMQKIDANGNVLPGAEFDLMVTADNMTYKIGSYALDGTGQLAVENLLPGDYQLIETKAPEGFQLLTVPVEFTVSEEGEVALVSNAGNMAYISGDVLNVRNNPVVTPYYPPYEEETPEPPADTPEEPPLVEVEDPEIPLEDVEVEDPDVPLAEMEEIEEEEVPLTDVPKTSDGSNMMIWMMMALLSAAALVGIRFAERRER